VADNRRSSTRHDVDLAGRIKVGEAPESCQVKNLSIGGAFVGLGRKLPMGDRVTLWFRVPNLENEIEAAGTVRWATGEGIGIQFDGLRAKETWALGKYLESLPQSQ
jgi:hypothetical protein